MVLPQTGQSVKEPILLGISKKDISAFIFRKLTNGQMQICDYSCLQLGGNRPLVIQPFIKEKKKQLNYHNGSL